MPAKVIHANCILAYKDARFAHIFGSDIELSGGGGECSIGGRIEICTHDGYQ